MTPPFDLPGFIRFCRDKGDKRYPWHDTNRCALAQFGLPGVGNDHEKLGIPREVYRAVIIETPCTFSALADRLEALGK